MESKIIIAIYSVLFILWLIAQDCVVAHNANFDKNFTEERIKYLKEKMEKY